MNYVIKIMAALCLCSLSYASDLTLRFKPQLTLPVHTLGDLLIISHDNQHLSTLPLDSQPMLGEILDKKHLMQWVMQKNGAFKYQWLGKERIKIQSKLQTTDADLVAKAQQELMNALTPKYKKVELNALPMIPTHIRHGVQQNALPLLLSYPVAKRVCVWVNNGAFVQPIWFDVAAWQEVLTAREPLAAQQLLDVHRLELKLVNVAGFKNPALTTISKTPWLRHPLSAGQTLLSSDVDKVPAVLRGEMIKLAVHRNGVTVITEAKALEEGQLGELVHLQTAKSSKSLIAMITQAHHAEVSL